MGLKEWTHNLCHSGDSLANVHYGLEPVNPVSPSLVAMLQFFHDDGEKYSLAEYEEYWKSRGLASPSSTCARLGSWNDVKARVRQCMCYAVAPDGTWEWGEAVLAVYREHHPRCGVQ